MTPSGFDFNALALVGESGNPHARALRLYLLEKGIRVLGRAGTGAKALTLVCQTDSASLELPPPEGLKRLHGDLSFAGCHPSWVSPSAVSIMVDAVSCRRLREPLVRWVREYVPAALLQIQGAPLPAPQPPERRKEPAPVDLPGYGSLHSQRSSPPPAAPPPLPTALARGSKRSSKIP